MLIEPAVNLRTRLAGLIADPDGAWFEALVMLFQAPFEPGSGTTYAEIAAEECDFTGYARSAALVWGLPYSDELKRAVVVAGSVQFQATGSAVTNNVGGYAVLNAAGTGLLWAEKFDVPRVADETADAIIILPKYVLGRLAA